MSDLTDSVLRVVAEERAHQDSENGPDHDDGHAHGELAIAAAAMLVSGTDTYLDLPGGEFDQPWHSAWGYAEKYEGNRERQVLIAAAWCVAELERLLRERRHRAIAPFLVSRFKDGAR